MRKCFISVLSFLVPIVTIPGLALNPRTIRSSEADAGELRPGAFIWQPALERSGPLNMLIDLRTQRAYVYRDGVRIGVSTISSGKPGHETPTGAFTVLEKEKVHHSNRYNNAPMPYMQRLTEYGLALHGGHLPGYPASHGCVRLPLAFAKALFKESTLGMTVVITSRTRRAENTISDNGAKAVFAPRAASRFGNGTYAG